MQKHNLLETYHRFLKSIRLLKNTKTYFKPFLQKQHFKLLSGQRLLHVQLGAKVFAPQEELNSLLYGWKHFCSQVYVLQSSRQQNKQFYWEFLVLSELSFLLAVA